MQIYIPSVKSEIQLIKYKDAVIINIVYKAYEVPFKEKRNLIFWLHQLARALKKVLAKLYKSLIYHHFKIQIEVHFIFFFFWTSRRNKTKQNVFVLKLNGVDGFCTVGASERSCILVTRTETCLNWFLLTH